ncbi:MAG: acyl-CoA thioester hydrolase [Psychroserpens sp.]|jgi:acyl-CoA thioester hydrolase
MYYFKEVFPGKPVKVSLELVGLSEDVMFFEFHHNFYDGKGRKFAHCEMIRAWIDMNTRALTVLGHEFLKNFNTMEKSPVFHTLTKENARKYAKKPMDLV